MARINNGITGAFHGKVGPIVGATWKGIPYMRSLPEKPKTKRKASKKAKTARDKFAMAQYWLRPLLDFVREGFKGYTPTVEGFIAAKSYLMKNAMETTDNGTMIDPAKVQVSYGDLPLPGDISVEKNGNELIFSWDAEDDSNYKYDQCMLLAYDVEKKAVSLKLTGQFRYTGSDSLPIYTNKHRYHVYIAFVAADRSRRSHSVYLGEW